MVYLGLRFIASVYPGLRTFDYGRRERVPSSDRKFEEISHSFPGGLSWWLSLFSKTVVNVLYSDPCDSLPSGMDNDVMDFRIHPSGRFVAAMFKPDGMIRLGRISQGSEADIVWSEPSGQVN